MIETADENHSKFGKADKLGLRNGVAIEGKADKESREDVVVSNAIEDFDEEDAVFHAYELQTAMPTGYHTVSDAN